MINVSIHEIKKELSTLDDKRLIELCLRLGRYKKENKELLAFLLFNGDPDLFLDAVKSEVQQEFSEISSYGHLAKKGLRKILKSVTKYCKFSQSKSFEIEIRMYYLELLNQSSISVSRYPLIRNLYIQQLKYIAKSMAAVHEDLQFDYKESWEKLKTGYEF